VKLRKQKNDNVRISYPECYTCSRFNDVTNTCKSAIGQLKLKHNRLSYEDIILSYKHDTYDYNCDNHTYPPEYWRSIYKLIQNQVVEPFDDEEPTTKAMIYTDYVEKIAL